MFSRKCSVLPTAALLILAVGPSVSAQSPARRPLSAGDIDAIARLEMMEDRRQFDSTDLAALAAASHPEIRRRAALTIARIADKRGIALLRARPLDADTAVAATEVFAIGQMHDTTTIAWFDSLLSNPRTPETVATEAAVALGKMKTAGARDVLARSLALPLSPNTLAEALLSIGRAIPRGDIAPIVRWTKSSSEEIRWRATWALFRPRDPAAVTTMVALSKDPSALVRSWAVRALTKPQADSAGLGDKAEATLLAATHDADRRVSTEAIRTLGTYTDSAAVAALVIGLASPDSWMAVSAAEGLGRARSPATVAALVAATGVTRPYPVRLTSLQSLGMFAPDAARPAAFAIANGGTEEMSLRIAAVRAVGTWGTAADTAALHTMHDALQADQTLLGSAITTTIAGIDRRLAGTGRGGRAGGGGGRQGRPPTPLPTLTLDDYRRIVERWVVPDYNGAPRPTARLTTNRGAIDIELYPGDAPLATEDFARKVEQGTIVGTVFTRVVPDFVDQQETIRGSTVLRDEVNRHRLTRANVAWATAGLDTGSPGYTFNHTPQPHNEGDFTSLGHVIRGMDIVDRTELGDRIVTATMLIGGAVR